MINSQKYIGKVFELKKGITATILDYKGALNVKIILSNGVVIEKVQIGDILRKNISNPLERTICDIGYIGSYKYHPLRKKAYSIWACMIKRCYDKTQQAYVDCVVDEEWHDFSNFMKWYVLNYFEGCCIDKDIKVKNNRTYSKETCMMVPREINNLIVNNKRNKGSVIGVRKSYNKFVATFSNEHIGMFFSEIEAFLSYKNVRENFIKDISLLYYSNGLISLDCYESLNKWTISISD